ncbi:hypothetical protein J6590_013386 [Homalodisca vitripennis]|nr:hypothetical protein J6590_013386 [Homalodisca vitripennis]
MSEDFVVAGVVALSTILKADLIRRENERTKRRRRGVWVKPWIRRRESYGASSTLLRELKDEDATAYRNILRITSAQFDVLLGMVDGMLKKRTR